MFGQVLARVCQARGVSQQRLAEQSGIDKSFASLLFRDLRGPRRPTVDAISEALALPSDDHVRLLVAAGYLPSTPAQVVRAAELTLEAHPNQSNMAEALALLVMARSMLVQTSQTEDVHE